MSAIRSIGPQFTTADAARIAKSLYGIETFVRELPSERDQNFLFKGANEQLFTLKIANRDEKRDVLDLQNAAIGLVGEGVAVIPAKSGQAIEQVDGHFVRLVTFIPGVPFAEFRPHTSQMRANIGRLLGRVDSKLATLQHPAARRSLYWDIRNAEAVISEYKHLIKDAAKRAMVEDILRAWHPPQLRTSLIHNDANDYNIIVEDDDAIGLIDFGDMLETFTVSEPAIACAYAMLGKPDPIAAASDVIRGYHEVHPLTETEIEWIYAFIRTRLAMSVTISAHQKQLEPDNEYLLISEKPAWTLIEKLSTIPANFAHYMFRNACGLAPCPQTKAITDFIRKADCARVVDADLSGNDAVLLDLSIDSLELGSREEHADVARLTTRLFRSLDDAGAKVAIGRYDEPRGVYTSLLFSTESNDGPEWRTIHLGIDLFMRAGSPLFTPLDGVIHSVRNNAGAGDYGPTVIVRHETNEGLPFFTLYGHLSDDSMDFRKPGERVRRGDRVANIGTYPTNGGWAPHVHFEIITDMLDRDGEFPGVALPSQRPVWLSLCPDPNLILRIPESKLPKEPPSRDETFAARKKVIGPNLSVSYRTPLKIVRGFGATLYDDVGRGYLDCVNNVAHVGHSHPRVVRAAQQQMAVLNTNTRYLHDNIITYAGKLIAKLPAPLSVCFFVNSGSEANDLALRIARAHTKSNATIVMEGGYHGNLTSLIDISPYKFDGPGGSGAPPHVRKLELPSPGLRPPSPGGRGVRPTFIIESILSCAGQVVLPDGYLKEVHRQVHEAGGVCIADEVQVGFGRVGTHFWGFETQGVVPDIVTLGKSIGNGHPLGAVVTTAELAASFNNGMEYFNTYGGNPVSCAVGSAVLDVIESESLQKNALTVGNHLKTGLQDLQSRHARIGDVRGLGLFLGIELVRDRKTLEPAGPEASYVVERMKARGILLSTDGPFHNVIKIKPPMVFSAADADRLISALDVVLGEGNKLDAIQRKNRF